MKHLGYFFLLSFMLLTSCNFNKVAKVDIVNSNPYPISIRMRTLNVEKSFESIPANSKITAEYDWTQLSKEEGQFIFFVTHSSTGQRDSFAHGFIRHGELYNYIYLDSKGDQLKVEISN
jgi:hypothetical protein